MKRIFAILLLLSALLQANAQLRYGVHAGLGVSNAQALKINGAKLQDCKSIASPMAGFILSYETNVYLDLQAELNFVRRGFNEDIFKDFFEATTARIRSNYLELPIMIKFYPINHNGFNVQAGPQIGCLLTRSASVGSEKFDSETLFSSKNNNLDFGFNFGLGYLLKDWSLDCRYYLGLTKPFKSLDGYRNRGFHLSIGYYFK